jgi:hypothetical protein
MSKYDDHSSLPVNFEGFINARMPADVFMFFDDFIGSNFTTTHEVGRWYQVPVGTGDAASEAFVNADDLYDGTLGGCLRITTGPTADEGSNFQVDGTHFLIQEDTGLPLYYEARIRTADVSNCDFFIGLSAPDIEICTTGISDAVGFLLESGVLYCTSAQNSLEKNVSSGVTMSDGAAGSNTGWIRVKFIFDGKNTVSFFIDDDDDGRFDFITSLTVSTTLDYLPDDEALTPTIEAITGATATAETFDIDYVYVAQQRYHT